MLDGEFFTLSRFAQIPRQQLSTPKASEQALAFGYEALLTHNVLTECTLQHIQLPLSADKPPLRAEIRYLFPQEQSWDSMLANNVLALPESLFRPELGSSPCGRAILSGLPWERKNLAITQG